MRDCEEYLAVMPPSELLRLYAQVAQVKGNLTVAGKEVASIHMLLEQANPDEYRAMQNLGYEIQERLNAMRDILDGIGCDLMEIADRRMEATQEGQEEALTQ